MFAVGQQNHDLTARAGIFQPLDPPSDRIADIGLRFGRHAARLSFAKNAQQGRMTQRERTGAFRARRKRDQADQVLRPAVQLFSIGSLPAGYE